MQRQTGSLIEQLAERYAHIQTYQDVGETRTNFHHGTFKEFQTCLRFSTTFKRPNLFRFECTEKSEVRYLLISDGTAIHEVNRWKTEPDHPSSVTFAKSGSLAVIAGVAPPVLQFLLPGCGGNAIDKLTDIENLKLAKFRNEPCRLLRTTLVDFLSPRQTDLWISKERLIFRKVREAFTLDSTRLDVWNRLNEIPTENFEQLVEEQKARSRMLLENNFPRNSNLNALKRDRLENGLEPSKTIVTTSYNDVSIDTALQDNLFSLP